MARLRYNGLTATLGAALTSSDTTITFAAALTHSGGTAVPTVTGSDYIPLTILATSDPDSAVSEIVYLTAYTAGATTGTVARAQESTPGVAHAAGVVVVHGPTTLDFSSSGGSVVLACAARTTSATYSTSSTTDIDVDAANLAVTFVAPSSGKVLVESQVWAVWSAATGGTNWTLRSGTTTVATCSMSANQVGSRQSASFHVSGLTPGQSYTYKWGWRVIGTGTASMYMGGNAAIDGPAIMKVVALP